MKRLLLLLILAGCADKPASQPLAPTISVTPSELALVVGSAQKLTASCTGDCAQLAWSSDNAAIASVDAAGLVKAIAAGSANVTARVGEVISAPVAVAVTAQQQNPTLTAISVTPATLALAPN